MCIMIMQLTMERRMRRKSHVRCEAGENLEMISKGYLSLLTLFGGFAPNSHSAEVLSKSLGSRTVSTGSVSKGKNDPSRSLQMMERPLMTADELKALPFGSFVVSKTGKHPMRTRLELFFQWGIVLDTPYEVDKKDIREVKYADRDELIEAIANTMPAEAVNDGEAVEAAQPAKPVVVIPEAQNTRAKLQGLTEGVK